jgi:hypothetical protein
MDWAFDQANRDTEVEAVDLPEYVGLRPTFEFVCPAEICRCLLNHAIPEKRVPYFRTWPGHKHHPDCDIDGAQKLVSKARRERLDTRDEKNFAACPARLVLKVHREVVDSGAALSGSAGRTKTSKDRNGESESQSSGHSRRTVGTIRQICRAFLNYPHNRDQGLSIPGIDGHSYLSAFKKIPWEGLGQYPSRKIFYAPLHWSKFKVDENSIEISLDAGLRENKKLIDGHKVIVDWSDWSKAKRTVLQKELEGRLEEAKEAAGTKNKAWLFFIGEQDPDGRHFRVNDSRLICCFVDELIWVSY